VLSAFKWSVSSYGYAGRRVNRTTVYMHREILKPEPGIWVDHINGDRLDNRRANLRRCNRRQNAGNSFKNKADSASPHHSQYKGVTRLNREERERNYWAAYCAGRYVGMYATEIEAARAYDDAARKHFGEFARLNFPNEGEQAA